MSFDFIDDLDEYFCEKYANYDKLCILPGYEMPQMQTSERLENGLERAYTLPASTMRLAAQKNKTDILALLKEKMTDETFSFSFRPLGFFSFLKNRFGKNSSLKTLNKVLARYNIRAEEAGGLLAVDENVWKKICAGKYMPTKNLLFSLAMAAHMSPDDLEELFLPCGFELNYALVKDTVIAYLLTRKVYNADMVRAAFAEYKISNLFIKIPAGERGEENAATVG